MAVGEDAVAHADGRQHRLARDAVGLEQQLAGHLRHDEEDREGHHHDDDARRAAAAHEQDEAGEHDEPEELQPHHRHDPEGPERHDRRDHGEGDRQGHAGAAALLHGVGTTPPSRPGGPFPARAALNPRRGYHRPSSHAQRRPHVGTAAARADELAAPGLGPRPGARWRCWPAWTPGSTSSRCWPRARRRAHHPQRRRPGHRRRDPLAERLPAAARHRGDRRRHARRLRAARRVRGRVRPGPGQRRRPPDVAPGRLRRHRGGAAPGPRPPARSPELTARDHVRGFIFDPETGALREST